MTDMTREQAQAALDAALKDQSLAKSSLAEAVASVSRMKVNVMEADAKVMLARATLARLGGPIKTSTTNPSNQQELCAAVVSILSASAPAPMTNEAIFAALQNEGVEMAGDKARSNLSAYIARWAKVPGADIVSAGRGRWTVKQVEVPSFLAAPTGTVEVAPPVDASKTPVAVEVPPFLAGNGVVEPVKVEPPQDSDDQEDTSHVGNLPEGFPGRQALIDAGFETFESLEGKTHDQLRRIKGVGAQTARDILAALEG